MLAYAADRLPKPFEQVVSVHLDMGGYRVDDAEVKAMGIVTLARTPRENGQRRRV